MCYVIRYWTFTGFDAVNNLNRAASNPRVSAPVGSEKGTGTSREADGFMVNEIDDF